MRWIILLLTLINALLADRCRLALENVALRQQLTILRRTVKRAKLVSPRPVITSTPTNGSIPGDVVETERLGGLLRSYHRVAA